jgi:hypothetical protein
MDLAYIHSIENYLNTLTRANAATMLNAFRTDPSYSDAHREVVRRADAVREGQRQWARRVLASGEFTRDEINSALLAEID